MTYKWFQYEKHDDKHLTESVGLPMPMICVRKYVDHKRDNLAWNAIVYKVRLLPRHAATGKL